jgi:hypothetical protein
MGRHNEKAQFTIPIEEYERVNIEDQYFDSVQKSKTIALTSGGEVTLTIEFDPSTLLPKDREFMSLLVNTLANYERSNPDPTFHDFSEGITDDDVPF